jgi:hypothetical protein
MRAYRRARARKNDHDCEPIHIGSGVGSARSDGDAGDFRGPVTGAAGTRHFEPDGVFFWIVTALADGGVSTTAGGCASSVGGGALDLD